MKRLAARAKAHRERYGEVYDELLLAVKGKALEIVSACKSRNGADAWRLLLKEYGKRMEGDRQIFQRRISDGEVVLGQKGMIAGDSAKSFIRDLDYLHSALYAVCTDAQRHDIPELTDSHMKTVLLRSVPDDMLPVLTNYDAFKGSASACIFGALC